MHPRASSLYHDTFINSDHYSGNKLDTISFTTSRQQHNIVGNSRQYCADANQCSTVRLVLVAQVQNLRFASKVSNFIRIKIIPLLKIKTSFPIDAMVLTSRQKFGLLG